MIIDVSDSLNLISKLTFKRVWNILKVTGSYYYSRWTGQPYQAGVPISFAVEPTTACNLGCPECPSGLKAFSRPTGNLKADTFRKIVDEMAGESLYLTFYFQGEPYIHPHFLENVSYASGKGMYTSTSTNAHFLTDDTAKKTVESGLDRLIISIDGTTQDTYESYRVNGKLEKVLEGARHIVKWKRQLRSTTPRLVFQFLVVKPNEHQIEEVKVLAKEIGVDVVKFKTAQLYDYRNGHELMPDNERYSRYKKQADGTYQLKNKLSNHCWKLWNSCVFTWDGQVVPCCFDKDARHRLGDIHKHSFREIWQNEAYRNFRSKLLTSRKEIDICSNCSEGTKVWN